jgi:hypothetical protein
MKCLQIWVMTRVLGKANFESSQMQVVLEMSSFLMNGFIFQVLADDASLRV